MKPDLFASKVNPINSSLHKSVFVSTACDLNVLDLQSWLQQLEKENAQQVDKVKYLENQS